MTATSKRVYKWYKHYGDIKKVAEVLKTTEKKILTVLKKHYPFLFENVILLVDSSYEFKEKSEVYYIDNSRFKNSSDIYRELCGAHMQSSDKDSIVIDRIGRKFSWRDYRVMFNILSESIYPIIIITEDMGFITPSVKKKFKILKRQTVSNKERFLIKDAIYALFNEPDRQKVLNILNNLDQPFMWIIGWLREIIVSMENKFVQNHLLGVLRFVDDNKFKISKDFLHAYLAFSTFPMKVYPKFPLQWKHKAEEEKPVEIARKIRMKKSKKKKKKKKQKKAIPSNQGLAFYI